MFNVNSIVRKNVADIKSYQVTRDKYLEDEKFIFLDNCENNYGSVIGNGLERYPSSSQEEVKKAIAKYRKLKKENVFLGNGSDEIIDLLIRCFCEPTKDEILICEPTFGMYKIYAQLNNVKVNTVPLNKVDFTFDVKLILKSISKNTKILFICSPNNPTGTSISAEEIKLLSKGFNGLIVIDEAYIDFSDKKSALSLLKSISNLLVLQTFSKGWGLAGLRVGAAYASAEITSVLNKVRPPFNLSSLSQQLVESAIDASDDLESLLSKVKEQKKIASNRFTKFPFVKQVFPSDGNFFLMQVDDAEKLSAFLLKNKILISNRSSLLNCENCVRISIGTKAEMNKLYKVLKKY
jgi:histidinol-phosphate aminotransferase